MGDGTDVMITVQGRKREHAPEDFHTPTLTDTDPDSPSTDNSPEIKGNAVAGSTVDLYTRRQQGTHAADQGQARRA